MIVDHRDIAEQAFAASHLQSPPRQPIDALMYITRLLSMLTPFEGAGYVQGPAGGENVAELPNGGLVRVSRVIYPDGQIYKVMNDAPNGGPQWVAEDVRPDLYVPYAGVTQPPPVDLPPPNGSVLEARVAQLEQHVAFLEAQIAAVDRKHDALHKELTNHIGLLNAGFAKLDNRTFEGVANVRFLGSAPVRCDKPIDK